MPKTRPPRLTSTEVVHEQLDMLVSPADRQRHSALVVLCEDERQPVMACTIEQTWTDPTAEQCEGCLAPFATMLADEVTDGAFLLAVTRPGPETVTDADRRWFRAAHRVAARHGVLLLGVHLVTGGAISEVRLDDVV